MSWWRDAVFYQIYPRSFADSNADGIGDLRGITEHLDHLAGAEHSLGVDALWLSPIYRSPMADFGYDISDHRAVDPIFGSLDDFDQMLEEAHRRGLKVILDFVPNHTSDQHPWFVESRSDRTNPRRTWYVWRLGRNGGPPNNWLAEFRIAGPAWTRDETTGEWFLHSFLPEQPDLNWEEPRVEEAMHDVLRFWLERGVDGFRMDVIHKIAKDPLLGDNPTQVAGPAVLAARRHDEDWPTIHARMRGIRSVLRSFGERVSVGEVYVLDPNRLAAYIRTGRELDLAHNFVFLNLPWQAAAFRESVESFMELVRPRGWPSWGLNNHDHPRVASRYPGEPAARVAAIMLLTLRGTPFLFQGEELGLHDGFVPPERIVDVDGRDPERCPIPWGPPSKLGPGAGFTAGEPWLPVLRDAETRNVEQQRAHETSVLALYRRLLTLRRERPALRGGRMRVLAGTDPDVFAYAREDGRRSYLVVLGFEPRERRLDLVNQLGVDGGRVAISTGLDRDGEAVRLGRLALDGIAGLVIELGG